MYNVEKLTCMLYYNCFHANKWPDAMNVPAMPDMSPMTWSLVLVVPSERMQQTLGTSG